MSEERTEAPAWHVELAPELIGVLETRGWKDLEPGKAAAAILQSYRALELMKGAPPEQLLKLPSKSEIEEPDAWKAVWQRLGAPAAAEGYEFAEGTDEAFAKHMREQAAALNLPKDKAAELAKSTAKFMAERDAERASAAEPNTEADQVALKANWGPRFDANKFVALQAMAKAGIGPEALAALEKTVGYAGVYEHFLKLGASMGEDKFVTGGPSNGVMSREMALARKRELMNDTDWVNRKLNGGVKENKEMTGLLTIIHGED